MIYDYVVTAGRTAAEIAKRRNSNGNEQRNNHGHSSSLTRAWRRRAAHIDPRPTGPSLWRDVLPKIEDARFLAWEMAGYAGAIAAGRDRDISVAKQSEYLVAWTNAPGLEQAVFVGHDLGGGMRKLVTARHRDRCVGSKEASFSDPRFTPTSSPTKSISFCVMSEHVNPPIHADGKVGRRKAMSRPQVVAFDVVKTLFPLEPLIPRLSSARLASHLLETWFASFLRDAFALKIWGEYRPFRGIASANLSVLLGKEVGKAERQRVDYTNGHWV